MMNTNPFACAAGNRKKIKALIPGFSPDDSESHLPYPVGFDILKLPW
jgi:hypothetical protein